MVVVSLGSIPSPLQPKCIAIWVMSPPNCIGVRKVLGSFCAFCFAPDASGKIRLVAQVVERAIEGLLDKSSNFLVPPFDVCSLLDQSPPCSAGRAECFSADICQICTSMLYENMLNK